ncbi:dihydrolipoyl dehydrogenase family protein [Dongia sp.]|uniref:dihydrolipoyl dehydrogenase family protein n=1 Tax=Dongia sp. TaxID=1977262 RepID=UPI003750AD6E
MSSSSFDVVIIGGGNAGLGVTVATRKAGLSVALIEPRELGGTCPNRGCTPKKVLVAAAHALDEIAHAKTHCISVDKPKLDWGALIDREQEMIRPIPQNLEKSMRDRGVTVLRGHAKFAGPNRVNLDGRILEAKTIVIATGSKPRDLPISGAEHLVTSDAVLSDRNLPGEVVFIGGGVIALEFSHVYARAGATVTILETLPRLLSALDTDAVDQLRAETERIGVSVRTSVTVKRIEKKGARFRVVFEQDGKEHDVEADRVVNGAGRVADIDGLDLGAGQVETDKGRVKTDAFLRSTSNPNVYICGDAFAGSPQLSPLATYEGNLVGRNIVEGPKHQPDYASIPSCVYTIPALASVGLTEAKAKESGRRIKVRSTDMSGWISARTYAEPKAWAKLVIDEDADLILGAHIFGHAGEELIHFLALAMAQKTPAARLRDMVYAFPTFSADIKYLL